MDIKVQLISTRACNIDTLIALAEIGQFRDVFYDADWMVNDYSLIRWGLCLETRQSQLNILDSAKYKGKTNMDGYDSPAHEVDCLVQNKGGSKRYLTGF